MYIHSIATILCALAAGCSTYRDEDLITYEVPAEVQPYVNSFMDEYEARGGDAMHLTPNLIVRWSDTMPDTGVIGYCQLSKVDMYLPEVVLLRSYWLTSSEVTREILIYHELGHCLLNYDHIETDIYDVMFPSIINQYYYIENRHAILDKFFDPSSRPRWPLGMHKGHSRPRHTCFPGHP